MRQKLLKLPSEQRLLQKKNHQLRPLNTFVTLLLNLLIKRYPRSKLNLQLQLILKESRLFKNFLKLPRKLQFLRINSFMPHQLKENPSKLSLQLLKQSQLRLKLLLKSMVLELKPIKLKYLRPKSLQSKKLLNLSLIQRERLH